jgi:hypothetical protein
MCRYFDDYSLSGGYRSFVDDGLVSAEEAQAVSEFHVVADAYAPPNGDDHDHDAILSDPAWRKVVQLADAARLRLLAILEEPSERQLLLRDDVQP